MLLIKCVPHPIKLEACVTNNNQKSEACVKKAMALRTEKQLRCNAQIQKPLRIITPYPPWGPYGKVLHQIYDMFSFDRVCIFTLTLG